MSYLIIQSAHMKLNPFLWVGRSEGETIATFGDARLVKKLSGKIELIGGSPEDHGAAREWCSLFLHDPNREESLGGIAYPFVR